MIVAFTDDDCLVDHHWLATIQQAFAKNQCDGLFGQTLPYQPAKHTHLVCPCTIRFKKQKLIRKPQYHVQIGYGNNMAWRRQTLLAIGSPKKWLGPGSIGANAEDAELTLRALLAGKTVLCDPKLVVYHDRWLSAAEMKFQSLSYVRGEAACYGYLTWQHHDFAKEILWRNIFAPVRALKQPLKKMITQFSWQTSKKTLIEIYWTSRLLLASFQGLTVSFYFFLQDIISDAGNHLNEV